MHALLLSPYDAHSHRRWRKGLVTAFPDISWRTLTLPPRHFNWRIRGNALSWAGGNRDALERPCDLLVATSVTDLATLKGVVPCLAGVPSLVYCHENQFAYPAGHHESTRIEPKMVSLYTALAADRLVFNSRWNRDSFLQGVTGLLQQMPDGVPPGVTDSIADRSGVIPVPLESHWYADHVPAASRTGPLSIVWNHRWEYDKAPERLFSALLNLQAAGVDFRVHVIGQQFRRQPPVFAEMYSVLESRIGAWGWIENRDDYRRLLQRSHVVLSTALHEFQGLAVLEGVASGCIPLVPDRLAYPEFIGPEYRYPSRPEDPEEESMAVARCLSHLAESHRSGTLAISPDVTALSWSRLRQCYEDEIRALCG